MTWVNHQRKFGNDKFGPLRLVSRRERWALTIRGWLLILILLAGAIWFFVGNVYGFLAVNKPLRGEVLVVEGWVPDYALEAALKEFDAHGYDLVITTGGPLQRGFKLSKSDSIAGMSAETLVLYGADKEKVVALPAKRVKQDRTYNSAVAVKAWFRKEGRQINKLDVVTLGVHARRTRYLYREAFDDQTNIGVIPVVDQEYDPRHWWRSSEGVKEVVMELIAYLYTCLFFQPD